MNSKVFRNLAAFTLFALMFFKVSAMHVYSHQDASYDEIENCSVCDSAIENLEAEFLFQETSTIQIQSEILFSSDISELTSHETPTNKLHFRLFGRPPPKVA